MEAVQKAKTIETDQPGNESRTSELNKISARIEEITNAWDEYFTKASKEVNDEDLNRAQEDVQACLSQIEILER